MINDFETQPDDTIHGYQDINFLNGHRLCEEYNKLLAKVELSKYDIARFTQIEKRLILGINSLLALENILEKANSRRKISVVIELED